MSSYPSQELGAHDLTVPAPVGTPAVEPAPSDDRLLGGNLRERAARGALINAAFLGGLNVLGLLKGVVVAKFLTAGDYGIWGLVAVAVGTLLWLASVGVDDKYIQQDHPDQQVAFEIAFTLQTILCGAFMVLMALAIPLFALLYGRPGMIAPGLALIASIPAIVLQTPLWVYYRRMQYGRQRALQMADPLVSFVITIALAIAGWGVWALVVGSICGSWSAAVVVLRWSPYPLRFRYEPGAMREYARFSWPLFLGSGSGVLVMQIPVVVASHALGLASVGAIALAGNISQFANRVDDIVTQALYPAVCAVKDEVELLYESFWKSNRLALLWAAPCGAGAALFAGDLVHLVLGEKWRFAVPLIQAFGLTAALNQVGFNWTAFFRARGETKPIAVANVAWLASALALALPLLLSQGLTAFGWGMAGATAVYVLVRLAYLRRLFRHFDVYGHVLRGVGPAVPAAAAILALRGFDPGGRGVVRVVAEIALFVAIALVVTARSERSLLRESVGYLRARAAAAA